MQTIRPRKIYVASSWRNEKQEVAVDALEAAGHEVYDFKDPLGGREGGFSWKDISPGWVGWMPDEYIKALDHPLSKKGFGLDFGAMKWADTFVLVLPCGRSAHLELGWACGQGKQTLVLMEEYNEPELMYKMVDHICTSLNQVLDILRG